MSIRGAILDVDGTLVDSNDAHAHAWMAALERNGFPRSYDEVRPLIGMGADKLLPRVAGVEKDSATGNRLSDDWKEIFEEKYLPSLRAFPKSRELVQVLQDRGLSIAIASSSEKELLGKLLKIAGVADLIEEKPPPATHPSRNPRPI